MNAWAERVAHGMDEPTFVAAARADVLTSDPDEVDAYDRAAPYWHCFLGSRALLAQARRASDRLRDALAPLHHREFRLLFGGRVVLFARSAMAPIAPLPSASSSSAGPRATSVSS